MEPYLRFYLKFQGYTIGLVAVMCSVMITCMMFWNNDTVYPLEEFYDYRFMGSAAIVFGVLWFLVGVCYLYGMYTEQKTYLFPFALMYLFDLFILVVRDIVMIWHQKRWYTLVFVNFVSATIVLYITCFLLMTLVALSRLFTASPKPRVNDTFVRFNNGTEVCASDDEESLVAHD